jgi:AmmeMemoRadiSam system protein B
MDSQPIERNASHAGTWYSDDPTTLENELIENLNLADRTVPEGTRVKGVIGPHAGLRWSGKVAAWSYKNIDPQLYD